MPKKPLPRRLRVIRLIGLLAGLLALWLLWAVLRDMLDLELLFCGFHKVTGYYCPGCGAMRALDSLLHFDVYQAVRFNVLFVLTLPALLLVLARIAAQYIRDGRTLPPGKWDKPLAVTVIVLAVAFGIARNLPAFSVLAPTIVG